jgi:transcriptional regulator with XRE-family HTH domain
MPRQKQPRKVLAETFIAERVRRFRAEQGWSLATFAQKVTEAGCPMHATAIQRIESGDPPRTISADEALAMASVIGISIGRMYRNPDKDIAPEVRELLDICRQEVDTYRVCVETFRGWQDHHVDFLSRSTLHFMNMFDDEKDGLDAIAELYSYLDRDEQITFREAFKMLSNSRGGN